MTFVVFFFKHQRITTTTSNIIFHTRQPDRFLPAKPSWQLTATEQSQVTQAPRDLKLTSSLLWHRHVSSYFADEIHDCSSSQEYHYRCLIWQCSPYFSAILSCFSFNIEVQNIWEDVERYICKETSTELLNYIHRESRQYKQINHRSRENIPQSLYIHYPDHPILPRILKSNHITACSDLRSIRLGISGMGGTEVSKGLTSWSPISPAAGVGGIVSRLVCFHPWLLGKDMGQAEETLLRKLLRPL